MAYSTVPKHYRDGSIQFLDGTGTPLTLTVRWDMGDSKITGLKRRLRDTVAYQARGNVIGIRHTDRIFPQINLSAVMGEFTETSTGTVADFFFKKAGTPYASAVSTLGSAAEVYTCDIKVTIEGTDHGDSADHTFTAEDVEFTLEWGNGQPAMWTMSGIIYGALTGDIAIATT